ncbi:MAG: hypothetical protein K2M95_01970 [Clostridiales bacterium]|nr:hypothetical protein [Clostridiales bacterium]
MDIFETYIQKYKRDENCRALTCKSYKKVYENNSHESLANNKTNFELATYGDALMKFALCSLLLDKVEQLSEYKKKYEEDKFLIEVVAKHYKLIDYMNFDRDDEKIPKKYVSYEAGNNNPTKYIATTVEAVIGAIYHEKQDFDSICELIKSWWDLE